jgi:hypothetical protein
VEVFVFFSPAGEHVEVSVNTRTPNSIEISWKALPREGNPPARMVGPFKLTKDKGAAGQTSPPGGKPGSAKPGNNGGAQAPSEDTPPPKKKL